MDAESRIVNENDLLETLQQSVGCPYLSNLHEPQWASVLAAAIVTVADERYSAATWHRAARYITSQDCNGATAEEIKRQLCAYLEQRDH